MSRERLELQKRDGIFHLELTAPPANRTDHLFFKELSDIIPKFMETDNIHGLIIHSRGRHFSSGADIDELRNEVTKNDKQETVELTNRSINTFNRLVELPYPVIAAIQGCCIGSGLELALACHYRIATPNAYFSLPETTFGLMPGCGGTIRLPNLVGLAESIRLILTGDSCLADDALKIGLIDSIADKKDLLQTAKKLTWRLQSSTPHLLKM